MKKLFLLLCLLLPVCSYAAEPLMLINPFRETFLNFPSALLGNDRTVTVFLPEASVPLSGKYPVIYVLGANPKDAAAARALLDKSGRKAVLVGINFTQQDLADANKIAAFFSRELVPYIDTNYPTFDTAASRGVACAGAACVPALRALLAKKALFTKAAVLGGGEKPVSLAGADNALRMLIAGPRAQATRWQTALEEAGKTFGPDFAVRLGEEKNIFEVLDLDYLFAPAEELRVKKLRGEVMPAVLPLEGEDKAFLSVKAWLVNGAEFDYVPLSLRLSPPYLSYDAATGALAPIAGATAGKVKISVFVDKAAFKTKIRLKK